MFFGPTSNFFAGIFFPFIIVSRRFLGRLSLGFLLSLALDDCFRWWSILSDQFPGFFFLLFSFVFLYVLFPNGFLAATWTLHGFLEAFFFLSQSPNLATRLQTLLSPILPGGLAHRCYSAEELSWMIAGQHDQTHQISWRQQQQSAKATKVAAETCAKHAPDKATWPFDIVGLGPALKKHRLQMRDAGSGKNEQHETTNRALIDWHLGYESSQAEPRQPHCNEITTSTKQLIVQACHYSANHT